MPPALTAMTQLAEVNLYRTEGDPDPLKAESLSWLLSFPGIELFRIDASEAEIKEESMQSLCAALRKLKGGREIMRFKAIHDEFLDGL